jgi:hypothetical protein
MKRVIVLMVFSLVLVSCKRARIQGKIFDGFGKPVSDAIIKVKGTQYSDRTDRNGSYSIKYVPGEVSVLVSKQGYTDTTFSANIATETTYPAEPLTIFEIPKDNIIYSMYHEKYIPVSKCSVVKQNYSNGDWMGMSQTDIYYVNVDESSILKIKKQDSVDYFLDCDPKNQTLFKLIKDSQNRSIILSRSTGGGAFGLALGDYREQRQIIKEDYLFFKNNVVLRKMKLDVGDYAFAQYNNGENGIFGDVYIFRIIP